MKWILKILSVIALIGTASCQALSPEGGTTNVSNCRETIAAMSTLQPGASSAALYKTGIRQAEDFDPNLYFDVLGHLSMQDGYTIDYQYPVDSLGAYPILYARPENLPLQAGDPSQPVQDYLIVEDPRQGVEDAEQGYFENVVLDVMAGQFYLDWHANYNDLQIICDRQGVEAIVSETSSGRFGNKMDIFQQASARQLRNIEPNVKLTDTAALVEVLVFTKWGGFHRRTYEISREFPHRILDVQDKNLVPYDCGIAF